jgi:hypothetical protein
VVVRGGLGVRYHYDDAGRPTLVEQTDSCVITAKSVRSYDAADRLSWIEHRQANDTVLLRIAYLWNNNNTLQSRTETAGARTSGVNFLYDARKRLVHEDRTTEVEPPQTTLYSFDYHYDQLGNRMEMRDWVRDRVTWYVYDYQWDTNHWNTAHFDPRPRHAGRERNSFRRRTPMSASSESPTLVFTGSRGFRVAAAAVCLLGTIFVVMLLVGPPNLRPLACFDAAAAYFLGFVAFRAAGLQCRLSEEFVEYRGYFRTVRIPWVEVTRIQVDPRPAGTLAVVWTNRRCHIEVREDQLEQLKTVIKKMAGDRNIHIEERRILW